LEGWAESLTYELKPFGIDVFLVEPGPCRTQMWESSPRFVPPTSAYRAWTQHVSDAGNRFVEKIARDPHEVANVIADALEARKPSFRYSVGPLARLNHLLHGKVPTRLLHRGVAWYLGLPHFRGTSAP
jgi:short-subunit dehydrogenase